MQKNEPEDFFVGTWISTQTFDSDDYLVEYTITRSGTVYKVTAKDYRDGESMKISAVRFNGHTLEFLSLMPSTGRKGINRFSVKDHATLTSEFTFTVVESLKRVFAQQSPQKKRTAVGPRNVKRTTQKRKAGNSR